MYGALERKARYFTAPTGERMRHRAADGKVQESYANWINQMVGSCNVEIICCSIFYFNKVWLKQRALSENRARFDDIKLAYKVLLRNFDKFDPNYTFRPEGLRRD